MPINSVKAAPKKAKPNEILKNPPGQLKFFCAQGNDLLIIMRPAVSIATE